MEKTSKIFPCGKLYTATGQTYLLLKPEPVVKDSWQLDNQQTWLVVPNEYNWEHGIQVFSYPRHIITSNCTVEYMQFKNPVEVLQATFDENEFSGAPDVEYEWPAGYTVKPNKE